MTIPQDRLDERDFQSLVSEARMRIAHGCPEWTEHNVSDPGITLIEQFAYMTEQLIYRVNRIPQRMHVALLDLLDIQLAPPIAARALLRFRLTEPARRPLTLQGHFTEVATQPIGSEDAVVFRVEDDFTIHPVRAVVYGVRRPGRFDWLECSDGVARPGGRGGEVFSGRPEDGNAFYLGFDDPISRLVLRVSVDVALAQGAGVRPRRPPLLWEASCGDAGWTRVEVLEDTTRGLNTDGHVDLQIPQATATQRVDERRRFWLRCRFHDTGITPEYTRPPVISRIAADVVGAAVYGVQAVRHEHEELGVSDGTPAQVFELDNKPALALDDDEEYLQVLDPKSGRWQRWYRVESFHDSERDDRHFRFDPATGEIELGPRIRTREGWRHHGAIPPHGARLRMTAYRQGGGGGNVEAGTLTVMRKSIAGVASVTNPRPSEDGVGVETLAEARGRAALELRTSYRAVTAEDYAFLAEEASPNVARAHCESPAPGKAVVVGILPKLPLEAHEDPREAAARRLTKAELEPDADMLQVVARHLDDRRVLGTSFEVQGVPLREVTVVVHALISPFANSQAVRAQVRTALFRFLNPLIGGEDGEGWRFGGAVNQGDLFAIVQGVEDVVEVPLLRMYAHDPLTGERAPNEAGRRLDLAKRELVLSGDHRVRCDHARD
jgi:predicted phage baseplate assembly protein